MVITVIITNLDVSLAGVSRTYFLFLCSYTVAFHSNTAAVNVHELQETRNEGSVHLKIFFFWTDTSGLSPGQAYFSEGEAYVPMSTHLRLLLRGRAHFYITANVTMGESACQCPSIDETSDVVGLTL